MTVLYILIVLGALLWLLGRIPVGVRVLYSQEGPAVLARLGPVTGKLFPRPKRQPGDGAQKAKKARKTKKPKKRKKAEDGAGPREPAPLPERIGGALEYARALLPVALDAGGCFARKLRVDTLVLELTAGAPDPADAAMLYGRSQAALAALWYPLTEAFQVKDGHAWTRVDFDASGMTLYAEASLSLRLGQLVWLGLCSGWRAAAAFLRVRRSRGQRKTKQRKAV